MIFRKFTTGNAVPANAFPAADLGLFRTKSDVNVTDGKYLQN